MKFPIALQAFTIRDDLDQDYFGTLTRVAQIGYQGVELGPPPAGTTVDQLKSFLAHHGLRFIATHIWIEQLDQDVSAELDYAEQMGAPYVALSSRFDSRSAVLAAAERFDRIGEMCRRRGMQLLYHNYDWEFERFDGDYALDVLLQATDPELLKLELDTYWAQRAGVDPAAYLRRLNGRCPLLHIKDMEPGDEQYFAEIGEGVLDWAAILHAAEAAGTAWLVVEQDRGRRPALESIAISYRNLETMGVV